jgi:putative Mg2+ transporter-C (MgtC) family protein
LSGLEVFSRLALAAVLTGAIGFDREAHRKVAGLRTHALVGMGAALFAILSANAFPGGDPSRIAAGVVAGVGFLGAGAIFRHGSSVQGLTTAAGLWVAAAIGLAAGAGELTTAVAATLLTMLALEGLAYIEKTVWRKQRAEAVRMVVSLDDPRGLADALNVVSTLDERARRSDVHIPSEGVIEVTFLIDRSQVDAAVALVSAVEGVSSVDRADA